MQNTLANCAPSYSLLNCRPDRIAMSASLGTSAQSSDLSLQPSLPAVPPSTMTPATLGSRALRDPGPSTERAAPDTAPMSALWGALPRELLGLVFARLPLPELLRLRRAAMACRWATDLDTRGFRQLAAQQHTSMCAVLVPEDAFGTYSIGVHAGGSTTWQLLDLDVGQPTSIGSSADGGLACFALSYVTREAHSLAILVLNPLTGHRRELRGHGVPPTCLRMMQLFLDRPPGSTCARYRVLLVTEALDSSTERGTFGGVAYDSATGEWTNTEASTEAFLMASAHLGFRTEILMKVLQTRPASYHCATRALHYFCGDGSPWHSRKCVPYALMQDRLFTLNTSRSEPMYRLFEHRHNPHAQRHAHAHAHADGARCGAGGASQWTEVTEHPFGPREHFRVADSFCPRVLACAGFAAVVDDVLSSKDASVRCRMAWLCDLSTGGWLDLKAQDSHRMRSAPTLLCELRWDLDP